MKDDDTPGSKRSKVDGDVYKTLLESTRAIPWKIDWSSMQFAYIGPQIEPLLGWDQDSWKTVQDWADRMHPDDRQWVVDYCVSQSKAGVDHEADYRALSKSGQYVWIRDVVHVVRNADGTVDALIGFMFDISERKKTEEQLQNLQRELEDFSYKDGLTGLANRRRFDTLLDVEFKSARRNQKPLALLMIDIDHFKQYNDHYGHVRGDECLQRVARALSTGASRPRDMLARYGGEEFVLVLPETDTAGAERVAARCRDVLTNERIVHANSSVAPHVTVSIGVGCIVPSADDTIAQFLEQVDRRLYRAKQGGRNATVSS